MKVLVTGGAGYIGSHTVKELIKNGYDVLVLDNFENGYREFVPCSYVEVDLKDFNKVNGVFKKNKINVVVHFAGYIEANESVIYPEKYYRNNVVNGLNLLNAMVKNNVKKIVYSSSAGVYGNPERVPIKEEDRKEPCNPYGWSKLMFENILRDYDKAYNMKSISLRYFNAAGVSPNSNLGEKRKKYTHLIPLTLRTALGKKEYIEIYGTDYSTEDGTCVRDYIHVDDLARAHILALDKLEGESNVYNVGIGKGFSVRQVIDACKEVTGKDFKVVESKRREGDPAVLVADSSKIQKQGWKPQYKDMKKIIETAWDWHKKQ